jgi:hypothetical protein
MFSSYNVCTCPERIEHFSYIQLVRGEIKDNISSWIHFERTSQRMYLHTTLKKIESQICEYKQSFTFLLQIVCCVMIKNMCFTCHRENVLDTGVGNFLNSILGRLTKSEPIMYAMNIDVLPTLSTTETVKLSSMTSNIQKLPGGCPVGIVSPTVYIGSEASTFNCHREDVAFEGVNRHVAGSPKMW